MVVVLAALISTYKAMTASKDRKHHQQDGCHHPVNLNLSTPNENDIDCTHLLQSVDVKSLDNDKRNVGSKFAEAEADLVKNKAFVEDEADLVKNKEFTEDEADLVKNEEFAEEEANASHSA